MELSLSQVWGGIGLAHDPLADRYIVEKIVRTQMALAGAKRSTGCKRGRRNCGRF